MAYGKKNKTKQHKPTTPQTKHRKGSKGNDLVFKPWVPVWVMTGSAKPSMSPISLQLTEGLLDKRQRSDVFLLQLGSYCILLFCGARSRCRSLISSPKWSLFFFFFVLFFSPYSCCSNLHPVFLQQQYFSVGWIQRYSKVQTDSLGQEGGLMHQCEVSLFYLF